MSTCNNSIIVQKPGARVHLSLWKSSLVALALAIAMGTGIVFFRQMTRPAALASPNPTLYELALNGKGETAVQELARMADKRGHWGPAPGDEVVYDAQLRPSLRASTQVADYADDCEPSKYDRPGPGCHTDFKAQQFLVRFGFFTYADEADENTTVPRPLDDMLSVYIEEVGHSWQEYLFETEGRGSGERTRPISAFESKYWAAGWEYQIKRYILSLDGTWLSLSDSERNEVKGSICKKDGYANPTKRFVPEYGAPPGWPNPSGWPTTKPTPEEFQAFCSRYGKS